MKVLVIEPASHGDVIAKVLVIRAGLVRVCDREILWKISLSRSLVVSGTGLVEIRKLMSCCQVACLRVKD